MLFQQRPGSSLSENSWWKATEEEAKDVRALMNQGIELIQAIRLEEVDLSKDCFDVNHCHSLLVGTDSDRYSSIESIFYEAAKEALKGQCQFRGKVYQLLADACSLRLGGTNWNNPFLASFSLWNGISSPMAEDFSQKDLEFFIDIIDGIGHPLLVARLADLIWCMVPKRDVKYANIAIKAYSEIPLETDSWEKEGRLCWQRLLELVARLEKGASLSVREVEAMILRGFEAATLNDRYLPIELSDLLQGFGLGKEHSGVIFEKLVERAENHKSKNEWFEARSFFEAALKWGANKGDPLLSKILFYLAEVVEFEADSIRLNDNGSHLVGAMKYGEAIEALRRVPNVQREKLGVGKKIDELHRKMACAGKDGFHQMRPVELPPIDAKGIFEEAKERVSAKEALEALYNFANLYPGPNLDVLKKSARDRGKPLYRFLFNESIYLGPDGRTVARTPTEAGEWGNDIYEPSFRLQLIEAYVTEIGILVQAAMLPGLNIMTVEHRFNRVDFYNMVCQSSIVPRGRCKLWSRGLFAGYTGDFIEAVHFLVPQVEHLVRTYIKLAGDTTTHFKDGIEQEKGLSSLMDSPYVKEIFGESIVFEIKVLFCDPRFGNLRNKHAHGLLAEDGYKSWYCMYVWWLCLRIVFNCFWFHRTKNSSIHGPSPLP